LYLSPFGERSREALSALEILGITKSRRGKGNFVDIQGQARGTLKQLKLRLT